LKVQIARSAYIDATIFQNYLLDVLIPKIEEFREPSVMPDELTILEWRIARRTLSLQ
jgi:hypothetical protein